jgi:hypothetical protein
LAYASIFIGMLFALALFFKESKTAKKENYITKEKNIPVIKETEKQKTPEILPKLPKTTNTVAVMKKKTSDRPKNKVKKNSIQLNKNRIAQQVLAKKTLVKLPKTTSEKEKIPTQNLAKNESKTIKKHIKPLSDKELNTMLASTLRTMNKQDTTVKKIRINTNQVLYVLENESNTTIKNKIIKTLIAGAQAIDNHLKNN